MLLVIEQNTNVEVGLKVFRVGLQGFLVVGDAIVKATLALNGQLLDALGHRVESINVFWIDVENLQINLFLQVKTIHF